MTIARTADVHASGHRLDDGRWQCKCGAIVPSGADWREHVDAQKPTIDPPGTCHIVGCPGKGQHPPHTARIGAGTWDDYDPPLTYCLGTPLLVASGPAGPGIVAQCSLDGDWTRPHLGYVDPAQMALLVDEHKRDCTNRSPR